ncbi:hypothetical protein [Saccharopolyspora sp. 5N708]|uniref:hypothetical protein n=1 Tax=Saccharopolyspora sp. 5N708 TaxID=3457424 RepID=UPI003FD34583
MILGAPIAGTVGVIDGEQRRPLALRDGAVQVDGSPELIPFDQVTAVFVEQQEDARPVPPQFPAPAAFGQVPDRSVQLHDLIRALQDAVAAALPS